MQPEVGQQKDKQVTLSKSSPTLFIQRWPGFNLVSMSDRVCGAVRERQ